MDKTSAANKIIHYRKLKGLTQEALAEMTGLNIRSIQRVEAGDVSPRLFTLKAIAEALEVNLEELLPEPTQHELNQLAVFHLTPVAFFLFPVFGNVLVPFIFWMMKREEISSFNAQGKDLINGQLTYSLIAGILFLVNTSFALAAMFYPGHPFILSYFMHMPTYLLSGLLLALILFAVLPVVNAIRVYNRKLPLKYPFVIRFFR